ncbi:glycosyl transferase [Pilimelia terevasa]|uniref:Glycosyl transferase n=1 Tax=Pilimelia terevasa TaxID=53372 RepID=A0A8J3FJ93_9ACTN|nr:glycosyltransferase family 2 protein [Pilimelia terevasa]GGK38206.1 glycosyl transferase [Pilimelia terevasa]
MPRTLSIITAAHAPSASYLKEAYESLSAQELPDGWQWEWLVQEDGETGTVAAALPADERIKAASARPGGPGVARTVALSRATGELIKNFDADDKLLPGALARDIKKLDELPEIGWTTSRVLDLLPNGEVVSWEHEDPAEGLIPRGQTLREWRENAWRLPIHPVTMCMRRDLCIALGGWMALTSAEDTGLLIPASVLRDGYFIHEPSMLYRKHPEQVTVQQYHVDEIERERRRLLIASRADALAQLCG